MKEWLLWAGVAVLAVILILPLIPTVGEEEDLSRFYNNPLHPLTIAGEKQEVQAFERLLEKESLREVVYTEFGRRVSGLIWVNRYMENPMDRQIAEEQLRKFCPEKAVEIINAADGDGELLTGGVRAWDAVDMSLGGAADSYRHTEVWELYGPIYARLQAEER